jgi:hypothetical protein
MGEASSSTSAAMHEAHLYPSWLLLSSLLLHLMFVSQQASLLNAADSCGRHKLGAVSVLTLTVAAAVAACRRDG